MQNEYFISIYLDVRRVKSNGKYPVKLRVFTSHPRIQKLYNTKFEFTEKEFESIWQTSKPRSEHKDIRYELSAIENNANEVAKTIIPFSITDFEKIFLRNKGDGTDIIYHYKQAISKLESNGAIGNASNYSLSLKSFVNYIVHLKGKEPERIPFADINPDWLNKYETYMVEELKRSPTTVSFYVRTLRTIFNTAISDKEIDEGLYPFGNKKYQPPSATKVKKSLDENQLDKLFNAKPKTEEQIKARDFWFFSYSSNGMNIKDIALLKVENLNDDKLVFFRAKTLNTKKTKLIPIVVYLNDFSNSIIDKYGDRNTKKGNYLFPILNDMDNDLERHKKIKNFTKSINQNLKKLASDIGISSDISTYWARHSFSTNAIRNGKTMEFVGEALNHGDSKTTMGYFAGFEDKEKKAFSDTIMNFKKKKKK